MKIKSLLLIAILSITGCATSGRIGDLPSVASGAQSTKLVLIRASNLIGAPNSYYVALDGQDIFTIRSGEYTEFPIPSGQHNIGVKCFGGWSLIWKEKSISFTVAPSGTAYFRIIPDLSCAKIYEIDSNEANDEMKRKDFISPSNKSSK